MSSSSEPSNLVKHNTKILEFIDTILSSLSINEDFNNQIIAYYKSLDEKSMLEFIQDREKLHFNKKFNNYETYFLVSKYRTVCEWLVRNTNLSECDILQEYIDGDYNENNGDNYHTDDNDDNDENDEDYTTTDEYKWKSELCKEWIQKYKSQSNY